MRTNAYHACLFPPCVLMLPLLTQCRCKELYGEGFEPLTMPVDETAVMVSTWCGRLGARLRPGFVPVPSFCYETFCYLIPRNPRGPYLVFSSCFCFDLFMPDCILGSRAAMSSSGPPKDSFFTNVVNPYMNELKMHPKELVLKDGKVQV